MFSRYSKWFLKILLCEGGTFKHFRLRETRSNIRLLIHLLSAYINTSTRS